MEEIWKPVKEWEDFYLVSNLGRVKSLNRITRNGSGLFLKKGRLLKNHINNKGYEYLYLKNKEKKKKMYVHRLVAMSFIPNPNNKKEVNHIDCNPLNNNVFNLEWVTHKENMSYMSKLGRSNKTGEWLNKIKEKNVANGKKVAQLDVKTNKVIKIFETIQSVKNDGFRPGDVCRCCKKIRATHKGYKWRYVNDRNS